MTLKLVERGRSLGSRFTAQEIREDVRSSLARGEVVRLDFGGVESITESFAHELFRLLASETVGQEPPRIALANCNPVVMHTIIFILHKALHSKRAPVFQ